MSKFKLLILDIDGTLFPVGRGNFIKPEVAKALNDAQEKSRVLFCLATGRSIIEATKAIVSFTPKGPSIFSSGSVIYDLGKQELITEFAISPKQFEQVKAVNDKYNFKSGLYDDGIRKTFDENITKPQSCFFHGLTPSETKAIIADLSKIEGLAVHNMGTSWYEGMNDVHVSCIKASKYNAVNYIAEYLSVKKDEIIGAGDGLNDMSMLEACGFKVAMGNANQEVKDIADWIAPKVNEDGILEVLERFITNLY